MNGEIGRALHGEESSQSSMLEVEILQIQNS